MGGVVRVDRVFNILRLWDTNTGQKLPEPVGVTSQQQLPGRLQSNPHLYRYVMYVPRLKMMVTNEERTGIQLFYMQHGF